MLKSMPSIGKLGFQSVSSSLLLIVYYAVAEPPVIELGPANQTVQEGGTVTFKCRAHGSPKVTVHWLFNGIQQVNGQMVAVRGQ